MPVIVPLIQQRKTAMMKLAVGLAVFGAALAMVSTLQNEIHIVKIDVDVLYGTFRPL